MKSLQNYDVPLVWTLHDMWAFTGGCHYDGDCGRYMSGCGSCPAIMSDHDPDLSSSVWRRKGGAYQDLKLSIVTPSRWLGDLARRSPLLGQFPVQVIPYAIDTDTYRPINKRAARESLGLPLNRKVILFGALRATSEKRKGFALLQSALNSLVVAPFCRQ